MLFEFADGLNLHVRFRPTGFSSTGVLLQAKPEPNDVDAVVWLPDDFVRRVSSGDSLALELETMLLSRHPEEIFAAEDRQDWEEWLEFFGGTREPDGRRKGVVEIEL